MYAADIDAVAPQSANVTPPQAMKPPKPQGWFSQLSTLVRRYVSVIVSDKGFLALTVIRAGAARRACSSTRTRPCW